MFRRKGRHEEKGRHRAGPEAGGKMEAAERALEIARQDREIAEERAGVVARLREGWERVHQRNNLASLFHDDLGSTR